MGKMGEVIQIPLWKDDEVIKQEYGYIPPIVLEVKNIVQKFEHPAYSFHLFYDVNLQMIRIEVHEHNNVFSKGIGLSEGITFSITQLEFFRDMKDMICRSTKNVIMQLCLERFTE